MIDMLIPANYMVIPEKLIYYTHLEMGRINVC